MLYVTKKVDFSAAHRLYNPNYSDEMNEAIYDKCNNYNGHGHNYTLEVTVCGDPDPNTGYVIDLKKLKDLLINEIVSKVDHKHLNLDVDFLKGIIPTVENLSMIFWKILENKLPNGNLYKIRLYETDSSFVDYYGQESEIKIFE